MQCLLQCNVTDLFVLSPFFLYCLWRCDVTDLFILSPYCCIVCGRCDVTDLFILSPLLLYCLWAVLRHWFVHFVPLIVVLSVAVWCHWFVHIVPLFPELCVAMWLTDLFIMSPFSCSVCGDVTLLICLYCSLFLVLSVAVWRHWFVYIVPFFLYCLWRCDVTDLFILSLFFLQCLWRCHAADPQFKSSATWKVHLEEKRHHDKHHPGQSKMTSASLNKLIQSKHDSSVSLSKFTQKSSLLKKRRGFSRAASISDRHGSCQSIPEFPEKCTSGQMCTSVAS